MYTSRKLESERTERYNERRWKRAEVRKDREKEEREREEKKSGGERDREKEKRERERDRKRKRDRNRPLVAWLREFCRTLEIISRTLPLSACMLK